MQSQQANLAVRLANVEVPSFYGGQRSCPLFQSTNVTGWPEWLESHGDGCMGISFAVTEKWPWLMDIFGDLEFFKAAICSYYALLNIIEFLDAANSDLDLSESGSCSSIPATFSVMAEPVRRRALRLLEDNRSEISEIWKRSRPGSSRQAREVGCLDAPDGRMGGRRLSRWGLAVQTVSL